MEIVKILGVDPSLRNTGIALIEFNTELTIDNPQAFKTCHCQTLVNPKKYTGTEAILSMLDMIHTEAQKECYKGAHTVLIESPAVMFNKSWSGGTISSIAHVAGGAVTSFGIEKAYLFRPNEWNKNRKKEVTANETIAFLGSVDTWHFEKKVKSEKDLEHTIDAASMALWWIRSNYLED